MHKPGLFLFVIQERDNSCLTLTFCSLNTNLGGGDKKILNFKTDLGNAKPKVGSKDSDIGEKQSPETLQKAN